MIARIKINRHAVRHNQITGDRQPVVSVERGKKVRYGHEVVIDGPCKVVYAPDKPLHCGATVWIETHAPITLIGETIAGAPTLCDVP